MLLIGTLLIGACGTIEKDKRTNGLQAATHGYESAIRWGYYETAFGYLHPDLRKGKEVPDTFTGLRLTGYDVVQPPVMQDETTATQVVRIDYLHEDTQVVKQLVDHQEWRWDDKLESWWLRSGLPKFE